MKILPLFLLSIHLLAHSPQADSENAKPSQNSIKVQSIRWEVSGWDKQNLEPVNVQRFGLNGVKLSGVCHAPKMYVINVPEGFDGFVSLDSARNSDLKIQAWPDLPNRVNVSQGIFKFVSMGNKISFKNLENKESTLYLTINQRFGDMRNDAISFTLAIQYLDKNPK